MPDPGDLLLLGTRKGLLLYTRRRRGYKLTQVAHAGIPVPFALRDPRTRTLWASLDHGHWGAKLSRSDDDGQHWTEVPSPAYPTSAEIKPGTPAKLRYLWVLAPGPASQPNRFYIGTEPGGLFVSDDGGASFELNAGLWNHPSRKHWMGGGRDHPGIHSMLVDPRDDQHLYVAISSAGVFESRDGGRSWAARNRGLKALFLPNPESEVGHDPHLIALCAAAPDTLWQQNHCGIFRSTDAGANWSEISSPEGAPRFGFPIAAHAKKPEVAWVVPASSDQQRMAIDGALCVCRTEDGGQSWESLREGLPQRDCFDLVLRHALDLDGKRLCFGSTTGNAYLSMDRGESWEPLGQNLPPIYSVRFA